MSSIRDQIVATLSTLVGLPLSAARRAADMRTFQFGKLRPVERGSVGDFALHVQCAWRIEGPAGMVTGRSDLWEPFDATAPIAGWDYEQSPNLQDVRMDEWRSRNTLLLVEHVDADDFGGAAIFLSSGFVLRLFPAGTRGEDWRLFRPKTESPHFVVAAGRPETE